MDFGNCGLAAFTSLLNTPNWFILLTLKHIQAI